MGAKEQREVGGKGYWKEVEPKWRERRKKMNWEGRRVREEGDPRRRGSEEEGKLGSWGGGRAGRGTASSAEVVQGKRLRN